MIPAAKAEQQLWRAYHNVQNQLTEGSMLNSR